MVMNTRTKAIVVFLLSLKPSFSSRKPTSNLSYSVTNTIKTAEYFISKKTVGSNHLRLIQDVIRSEPGKREDGALNTPTRYRKISAAAYNHVSLGNALCSCTLLRSIEGGIQHHLVAIKAGLSSYSYVGSCLITLYSTCFDLRSALKVFEEIPERNVVSWTALISGFAQTHKNLDCFHLYSMMRKTSTKPNDYTFSSLLSACCESGVIGKGKTIHGQVFLLGFLSYIHVKNALISMYSKCGCLDDAFSVFRTASDDNDVVSWNAMIAGFALHGLATRAIDFFEEMKNRKVKPDCITFLAVLSSCRHAGLLTEGRKHFVSMFKFHVSPRMDHYCCIVDMLGRAGKIEEAREVIRKMPFLPNERIWGSLLSSCRLHGNIWVGIEAAEQRLCLKPTCASTHVLLTNLYSVANCWDKVAKMRKAVKERGLELYSGYSWIEVNNKLFKFRAEDEAVHRFHEIVVISCSLNCHFYHGKVAQPIEYEIF